MLCVDDVGPARPDCIRQPGLYSRKCAVGGFRNPSPPHTYVRYPILWRDAFKNSILNFSYVFEFVHQQRESYIAFSGITGTTSLYWHVCVCVYMRETHNNTWLSSHVLYSSSNTPRTTERKLALFTFSQKKRKTLPAINMWIFFWKHKAHTNHLQVFVTKTKPFAKSIK